MRLPLAALLVLLVTACSASAPTGSSDAATDGGADVPGDGSPHCSPGTEALIGGRCVPFTEQDCGGRACPRGEVCSVVKDGDGGAALACVTE